jgi:acyl carrier protein
MIDANTTQVLNELKVLLNEAFDLTITEVKPEDSLTLTYGLTSIQLVQLAMQLEEVYGKDISESLAAVDTVDDLLKVLESVS